MPKRFQREAAEAYPYPQAAKAYPAAKAISADREPAAAELMF